MPINTMYDYAKEIGCCLGYEGSSKDAAARAIGAHRRFNERGGK